ncbi:MAG: helix-turn-helix transcriptional regulator [Dolichospermum sp.]
MITNLRKQAGLTQRQIALTLGLTDLTVRNWESGRSRMKLEPNQMLLLCKTLNCSLEQLANEMSDHLIRGCDGYR